MTEVDHLKISALDWVTFYEEQRVEAIVQVNALIFSFLTLGKIDAAQLAFNKIPPDAASQLIKEGKPFTSTFKIMFNISVNILVPLGEVANRYLKEFLSYKEYLNAHEAFNEWFKHFKSRPLPPENLSENAPFPEQVAHQHKVSQHKAELER